MCGIAGGVPPEIVEHDRFASYRDVGINRVSLGVQSFDDPCLARIGRIHGRAEGERALEAIGAAAFDSINIDLMYGLPGQSVETALADVEAAAAFGPEHLSHYQLTIEPNTAFHADPPSLPGEEAAAEMQERCARALQEAHRTGRSVVLLATAGRLAIDEPLMKEFFYSLSDQSTYRRFISATTGKLNPNWSAWRGGGCI